MPVAAAVVPLIIAGSSLAIALGVGYLIARETDVSNLYSNIVSMIGLAVSVDYSLFIVKRFREELSHGRSVRDAVDVAMARAGHSVLFSGAAVIVASKAAAERLGLDTLGEVVGYGQVEGPDPSLLTQPSRAIKRALEHEDMTASDVDLFELNEAFAAVGLASMRDLGISDDIVNANGGAIALGHPVGMSGTRVVLTLINELRRRGGGVGAAALCGGGGQGDAAILRTL